MQCDIAQYSATPRDTVQYRTTYIVTIRNNTIYSTGAVQCGAVQYSTVQYGTAECFTTQGNTA
eukprot:9604055-Lingulodinium_polyedra.AAC.1